MTRVLFMGSPAFAVPSLEALLATGSGFEVVGCMTQPDRPAGRGRRLTPSAVKSVAVERGIEVFQPTKMRIPETEERMRRFRADIAVVAAYGRILPQNLLDVPTHGCVNVHASLLPKYRGASPIAHAIMAGDPQAGVGIMGMEAGLDTGPVFGSAAVDIADDATCGSLTEELARLGAGLLLQLLPGIVDGTVRPVPQDDGAATYAPLLSKQDGRLDFQRPASELARRVRGLSPWPGTFAYKGEDRVQVMAVSVVPGVDGEAGLVVQATGKGLVVACGDGGLRLERVKPAGRKLMDGSAWVAGRGVVQGDRLT